MRAPDLSPKPLAFTVERVMKVSLDVLFCAWTEQFDRWFAAPGSVEESKKRHEDAWPHVRVNLKKCMVGTACAAAD